MDAKAQHLGLMVAQPSGGKEREATCSTLSCPWLKRLRVGSGERAADIDVPEKDLEITTMRSGGAGEAPLSLHQAAI